MVITKNNKIFRMHFLQVTTFVSQTTPIIVISCEQKKNKNLQNKGQIYKNHENWFYENWLFQEERPSEEKNRYEEQNVFENINDVKCI